MAASLATLQARKEALEKVMASGQLQVRFADRTVVYRSMEEMTQALALLEKQIAATEGRKRTRQIRVNSVKGWF